MQAFLLAICVPGFIKFVNIPVFFFRALKVAAIYFNISTGCQFSHIFIRCEFPVKSTHPCIMKKVSFIHLKREQAFKAIQFTGENNFTAVVENIQWLFTGPVTGNKKILFKLIINYNNKHAFQVLQHVISKFLV